MALRYEFEIDALRPEEAAEILWAMKRGDVVRYAYARNLGWPNVDPNNWLGGAMRRLADEGAFVLFSKADRPAAYEGDVRRFHYCAKRTGRIIQLNTIRRILQVGPSGDKA